MLRSLFVLVWVVPCLYAHEAPTVARGPSREPDPYRYEPKILKSLPKNLLEDAPAIVLYAATTYRIDADGTIETTTHEVTRLNSRTAVEKLGEFRGMRFTPGYEKLTLHVARISKANGKVEEVDSRHVHIRDVGTDYQSYDQDKQWIVSFPGLEVGDVIEVKWSTRGKNPEHEGQFFSRYRFGDPTYPLIRDEVRVLLPKSMVLHVGPWKGFVDAKIQASKRELDGQIYHRWWVKDCPPPPADDNRPSREELRPGLAFSTFKDWDAVGKWKDKLRSPCWECNDDLKKVVAEVTRGLKTPEEKARALTYYVRRKIRYLSAGERHDYTPHLPHDVHRNCAGDCKDSSQLLAVLLREAGIRSELVTLGTLGDGQIDPKVPSPWGTHAILAIDIGGKTHWVDTTARLCAWNELPKDDCDRVCYLTDDKGKLRLARTPKVTADSHHTHAETDVWIDDEGNTRNRRVWTFHGQAAVTQRYRFAEVPEGERRRLMTATLQDANSRARLIEFKADESSLVDYDKPVKLTVEFEVPRQFTGSVERDGSITDSVVWGRLLAYSIDHDRQTAMILPGPFASTHVYRVRVPAGWVLDGMPRSRTHISKWGSFSANVRALNEPNSEGLEIRFETRLNQDRIEKADLDAYRGWFDAVQRDYRVWITLKRASSLEAAPRLEAFLKTAPANLPAAKALARIYLKARRYGEARRVLEAAQKHAPENIELLEMRLDAAETAEQMETIHRELRKFQPEERRHILGLAAVLITRDKHDEARALLAPLAADAPPEQKARAHYQLARSHYRKDELRTALVYLDLAVKGDAEGMNTVRVWRLRGQILEESKQPAEALAAFRRAWELDRTNDEVALILVRLALETKDELTALDVLRRYVIRNSRNVSALVLAAETYYRLKRYDEAMETALRSREINFHERAQRILGLIYLQREDYSRAVEFLDRAEPDAVVVAGMVRAAALSGKPESLPTAFEKAAKLESRPVALESLLQDARQLMKRRESAGDAVACAEFALRMGKRERAEELLAQQANPSAGLALRARLALERGQLRQALADANAALKASPEDALALLVRGRVGLERATPGHLTDLEKAVALTQRRDADSLAALAEAYAAAERREDALKTAREAAALRPKDRLLAELVERLSKDA
jgi:tetratricopeptide (TPR) repeat protein